MQSGRNSQISCKGGKKEDINSRKTKSYHKGMKSDKNYSYQRNALDQKEQVTNIINRQKLIDKSKKNNSVKDSKCNSDIEYKNTKKAMNPSQDIDGKTQLNKDRSKIKKKQIEDELEHQQLVRQGLANSFNDKKIKVGIQRRQIISHDIMHPPINIKTNKSEKKQFKISQTDSQKMEDNEYDQIINEINLNNFESKVIYQAPSPKRQQTFLAKIQQSQSEVIASPLNYQKIADFHDKQTPKGCLKSSVQPINENEQGHMHKQDHKSILNMDSIQEDAINQSVEKTFKERPKVIKQSYHNHLESNQIHINIQPCESQISEQRHTQKKSNKVEQSKVIIATKVHPNLIQAVKDIKKEAKQQNKLAIINGIFEEKVNSQLERQSKEQQERKKLNEEIDCLKQAVRELKLQKIKARAEMSKTIDFDNIRSNQQRNTRYQTLNVSISEKDEQTSRTIFGKIRKNRSLSRKHGNYLMRSKELALEKELDLPEPLININKLTPRPYAAAFLMTENKRTAQAEQYRQYKTMNLEKIAEENLEESIKFPGNLTTSHQLPIFGAQLRSNKINMRGPQICTDVLNKFESSDRKFKKFIHLSSARSRTQATSNKGPQAEHIVASKNPQISKQLVEEFQSEQNNQFEGIIIKNTYPQSGLGSSKKYQSSRSDLKASQLIKEGQKVRLQKCSISFKVKPIPHIPPNPVYSTPTEQIMNLISQILPLSNIAYSEKDLEDCTLKKYKNCIMFELKRFPSMKIVWYFNGKLYVGEWDINRNEKSGFGKEISKDKYYYEGYFQENRRHGNGLLINESSQYDGEWINGEKEGNGKYMDSQQHLYYDGQWKDNKRHGRGHYEYEGNIFQGYFENNVKSGFGVELFKNGDRYIGNYANGKFEGQGKYIWFNRSYYLGMFHEGYREGLGRWQSGEQNYELYIGQFIRDKKQGEGKYIWNNRCVYEGSFFNDLKHGLGSILYPDGRYMEGIWTQGILTEVLNKVTEANREQPLEQPRSRTLQSRTIIKIVDVPT